MKIFFITIFFGVTSCFLKTKKPIQINCDKTVQGTNKYYQILNFEDNIESFKELDSLIHTRLKDDITQSLKGHIIAFCFGTKYCVNIDQEDSPDTFNKSVICYRFSIVYDECSESISDSTLRNREVHFFNKDSKKIAIKEHQYKKVTIIDCFEKHKITSTELANFIYTANSYLKENTKVNQNRRILFFLLDENNKKVCQIIKEHDRINLNFYFL